MQTKICTFCKRKLPLEAFGKCTKSKDGLKTRCKECRNKIKKEYDRTHKQQAHDYKIRYAQLHQEELKASRKIYKTEHREEIRAKSKIYYQKNKNIIKEKARMKAPQLKEQKRIYNIEQYNVFCIPEEKEKVLHYAEAKADNFKGWVRHHRLETHNSEGFLRTVQLSKEELIALDMYYNRPAEELIWLKAGIHRTVHGNIKGMKNGKGNI
jgi:hypothetical protein